MFQTLGGGPRRRLFPHLAALSANWLSPSTQARFCRIRINAAPNASLPRSQKKRRGLLEFA